MIHYYKIKCSNDESKNKLNNYVFSGEDSEGNQNIFTEENLYSLTLKQLIKVISNNWVEKIEEIESKDYFRNYRPYGESILNKNMTTEQRIDMIKSEFGKLEKNKTFYVTDPFIFTNYNEETSRYLQAIFETVAPQKIFIYHRDDSNKAQVLKMIKDICNLNNDDIKCIQNNDIHDRFYIVENDGLLVGTSINGINRKLFTICKLLDEDVEEVKSQLQNIN